MAKYKIQSPVKHDGKFLNVGEVVELPDEVGKYLQSTGSVVAVKEKKQPQEGSGKKSGGKSKKGSGKKSNE